MTKEQKLIEELHQRLMDIRDSTPVCRGFVTQEREYTKVYLRTYKTSGLSEFCTAVRRFRIFLQDIPHRVSRKGKTQNDA